MSAQGDNANKLLTCPQTLLPCPWQQLEVSIQFPHVPVCQVAGTAAGVEGAAGQASPALLGWFWCLQDKSQVPQQGSWAFTHSALLQTFYLAFPFPVSLPHMPPLSTYRVPLHFCACAPNPACPPCPHPSHLQGDVCVLPTGGLDWLWPRGWGRAHSILVPG